MKWWRVALGMFLGLGIAVAATSFYEMSLDGTMKKLGIADTDLSMGVSTEELTQLGLKVRSGWQCGLASRMKGAVEFLLSGDSEQGQLAYSLGEMRILCGAGMLQEGKIESGTYEVTKGMGYLTSGYNYTIERGSVDLRACEKLPGVEVDSTMIGILSSSNGQVFELLSEDWKKVMVLREKVDQICLDGRNGRR